MTQNASKAATYSKEDIDRMVKQDHRAIVIFEGEVFDTTDFKITHPGGPKYIDDHIGEDITKLFYDNDHSRIARRLLKEIKIGTYASTATNGHSLTKNKEYEAKEKEDKELREIIDPSRGTIYQVFTKFNREKYIEYVNDPKHITKPGDQMRMFDAPYLEIFSRTPWYVIPIVWVPVLIYNAMLAFENLNLMQVIICVILGMCLWTFLEYFLHRFIFHLELWIPDNRYLYTIHYVIHGVHHAFPMEKDRLVFPPVLGIPVYFLLYFVYGSFIPLFLCRGIAIGVIAAYIMYDLSHYYFHHEQPLAQLEYRKKYHMYHHYKDPNNGYGITTSFWDTVFGTEILFDKGK